MSILASNIQSQAESLASVLRHQCGDGVTALAQAASLLRSGRPVLITGMGASLFAGIPLEYFLCTLGINAITIEAGELLHYRSEAHRDAVAIIVSRSGKSVEIARLLAMLKGRQPIIGVTNEPESPLSQTADISIHISSLPDEMVAIQTYTGTLLALHLLGSAVADSIAPAKEQIVKEHINDLLPKFSALVETSLENLSRWDDFLKSASPIYLLARGPSLASAYAGALLFHEVAKTPAVAMAAASFRHGPVEAVDGSFRGLIFAPRSRTREINLALARDLMRFGGNLRLIGPTLETKLDSLQDLRWCAIPDVPETLTPLFEIVPLQTAALRLAELRGIKPGSFRYATQVTLDEASFGKQPAS